MDTYGYLWILMDTYEYYECLLQFSLFCVMSSDFHPQKYTYRESK